MPYKEKEIEKLYYSIGEVADMLNVNKSLLIELNEHLIMKCVNILKTDGFKKEVSKAMFSH